MVNIYSCGKIVWMTKHIIFLQYLIPIPIIPILHLISLSSIFSIPSISSTISLSLNPLHRLRNLLNLILIRFLINNNKIRSLCNRQISLFQFIINIIMIIIQTSTIITFYLIFLFQLFNITMKCIILYFFLMF